MLATSQIDALLRSDTCIMAVVDPGFDMGFNFIGDVLSCNANNCKHKDEQEGKTFHECILRPIGRKTFLKVTASKCVMQDYKFIIALNNLRFKSVISVKSTGIPKDKQVLVSPAMVD